MARREPPKLVTRAVIASFSTVTAVLIAVFVLITVEVRARVRDAVADNLASAQQVFTRVEHRRQREVRATVATLAENPTLKAALDTWLTERAIVPADEDELVATIARETSKLAESISADVLAVTDPDGRIIAGAGPMAGVFRRGTQLTPIEIETGEDQSVTIGDAVFRVTSVPLELQDATVGSLRLGTVLDMRFALDLAMLSRGEAAVVVNGSVRASTLSPALAAALEATGAASAPSPQRLDLAGEAWAVQPLVDIGEVRLLALASIDAAAAREMRTALASLGGIALLAITFAVIGSVWLARTLTQPIDRLSAALAHMAAADRPAAPLVASGRSRELDQLTATFNTLMTARAAAEAETEATYLGAVRALTASLDARDPYTAGHSERVSALAVSIGEQLTLDADTIEVLRLGALLHDVGKIGVPDDVLRKRGRLTADEWEAIRAHPTAGARILQSMPFLARHIPIVELHHERPDGSGYPYGLKGDAIPLPARIVHVADAFDAMTSARAYRPARLPVEAIDELRHGAGTDFDPEAVDALIAALSRQRTAAAGAPMWDLRAVASA